MRHILLLLLLTVAGSLAQSAADRAQFLSDFLPGEYQVIGRWPDSDSTYTGMVTLRGAGDSLVVIRRIAGREVRGSGRIETATADSVAVLRLRFIRGHQRYEGTYLIGSDLDNYPRLSGYIYLRRGGTKRAGLEAWFIKRR